MRPTLEFIDMDREELNQLVERARTSLADEDYRRVKGMAERSRISPISSLISKPRFVCAS